MSNAKSDPQDFSVVQFSLAVGPRPANPAGRPVRVFRVRGEGLQFWRDGAHTRRWSGLKTVNSGAGAEPEPVELIDTEWGYDIRCGWLVVKRFWVHDCSVRAPVVVD